jgi:uncharacterized protein (DUF2062 family)
MIKFMAAFVVTVVVSWFVSSHLTIAHQTAFIFPSTTFPVTYLALFFLGFLLCFNHILRKS